MKEPNPPSDTPSFEQLWDEYRQQLKAFLHSRLAHPDDADDVLQEVLLKSLQALPELKSQTSVKAWLFQIANRTLIDFYRARASHSEKLQALSTEELWSQPQEYSIQQELAQCLSPFIQQLPDDVSTLMREVELQGRSQKLLAAEQGISYSTLKSRVQKGRKQLRQMFEDCCQFSLDHRGQIMDCDTDSNRCDRC